MNILLLTSIYPQPDDDPCTPPTPVVESFTREWARAGHRVLVIHLPAVYPAAFYRLPHGVVGLLKRAVDFTELRPEQSSPLRREAAGITVYRIPMLKRIPIGPYTRAQIKAAYLRAREILNCEAFVPDAIVGHWENPQVPLLKMLGDHFPTAPVTLALHGVHYLGRRAFGHWVRDCLPRVDRYAFRSPPIERAARAVLPEKPEFLCYSGLPPTVWGDEMVEREAPRDRLADDSVAGDASREDSMAGSSAENAWAEGSSVEGSSVENASAENLPVGYPPKSGSLVERDIDCLYVGTFIRRKRADILLHAFARVSGVALGGKISAPPPCLLLIGDGPERARLSALSRKLGIAQRVTFAGRMPREDVLLTMKRSRVFAMVSDNEAFGLVYLEAMLKGCVVVATRGGSMDSIIRHGENGFLCGAGDSSELAALLCDIWAMPKESQERVRHAARETAAAMTDSRMAAQYLAFISAPRRK